MSWEYNFFAFYLVMIVFVLKGGMALTNKSIVCWCVLWCVLLENINIYWVKEN